MGVMFWGKDGGKDSTVWGLWLAEFKKLFSIVLLRFDGPSREAFHTHAFDSVSWVLRGRLTETNLDGTVNVYTPSFKPVKTYKSTFHMVDSTGTTWVLSFRGPWADNWKEYLPMSNEFVTLGHGRMVKGNYKG